MIKNKKIFYWAAAITYALLIFFLSSLSGSQTDRFYLFKNSDKVIHIVVYSVLCLLLNRAFFFTFKNSVKRYVPIIAIFISIVYAITDEFHQSFVPGRYASMDDIFADGIGAVISQIILYIKDVKGELR
ncbi:MAG: VanZ family protein [Nitrospirota bacterium]